MKSMGDSLPIIRSFMHNRFPNNVSHTCICFINTVIQEAICNPKKKQRLCVITRCLIENHAPPQWIWIESYTFSPIATIIHLMLKQIHLNIRH
ncbi:hypothetical protein XELAEV_18031286mg [Xenopus laevis]|uniref:Uncharacterized protein n=1 Tax=Xenopus laevis TaxID=8355 RepID=A0A974HFH1_XENLA|nr:hypothetical protein XELAEV_18031286mg [Xenopus laevis]